MGFYGNMNNVNKFSFQFDKVYNNRAEMEAAISVDENNKQKDDGVYVGRYVLIDYDPSGVSENTYNTNFGRDKGAYKDEYPDLLNPTGSRGWDSTVWQKTYKNGAPAYVMVAELNSVTPSFDIVVDAPTETPNEPHWDDSSSNLYYKLHLQPSWGMRVKDADQNEPSDKYRTVEIESEEGGEPTVQNIRQAIYWNQAGFDKNAPSVSEVNNSITISPAASGALYGGVAENDTYEISVLLPEIGNIMSKVWDIIYGQDRNLNIDWNDLAGNSAYRKTENDIRVIKGFDSSNVTLGNVAGVINSVHDLMGMIIVTPEKEENESDVDYAARMQGLINDASSLEDDKIYYINDKFYFKPKKWSEEEQVTPEEPSSGDEIPSGADGEGNPAAQEAIKLFELEGLGKDINTLHGLILRINQILLTADPNTKDLNTVQGALNKLNQIIEQYNLDVDGGLVVAQSGELNALEAIGDNWINIGPVDIDENGKTIKKFQVSHKNKLQTAIDNSAFSPLDGDVLTLKVPDVDVAGHITQFHNKEVTLPYGFKTIANITATSTKDTLGVEGDNYITVSSTFDNNNKKITITHKTSLDNGKANTNNPNINFNEDTRIGENQYTFAIPSFGYDRAGHINSESSANYRLPNGFKIIQVGEDSIGENNETIAAPTIVAANPIDTLKVESGNYVIPTIDNGKLKFDISFDNVWEDLKDVIDKAVHDAVYATTIQSNFWGVQIPIVANQSWKKKGAASQTSDVVLSNLNHISYGYGDVSSFYTIENISVNQSGVVTQNAVKIKQSGTYRIQASLGLDAISKYIYSMHIRVFLSKDNGANWTYICGTTESFDAVAVAAATYPVFGTPAKLIELDEDDLLKLQFEFRVAGDQTVTQALLAGQNSYLSLEKVENAMHKIKFMFDSPTPAYDSLILDKLPDDWKWGEDAVNIEKLLQETPKITQASPQKDLVIIGNDKWYFNGWQEYILSDDDIRNGKSLSDIKNDGISSLDDANVSNPITLDTQMEMDYKDHLLVGSWSRKRSITYNYANLDNLPQEVIATIPDGGLWKVGESYTISDPTETSIHAYNGDIPGNWTFSGWTVSPNTIEVENKIFTMPEDSNVTIIGSWTFTEDKHYTITYTYEDYDNLPEAVQATRPEDQIVYQSWEPATLVQKPDEVSVQEESVDTSSGLNIRTDYTYTCGDWSGDSNEVTIQNGQIRINNWENVTNNTEIEITGTWSREKGAVEYALTVKLNESPNLSYYDSLTDDQKAIATNALTSVRDTWQDLNLYYDDSVELPEWTDQDVPSLRGTWEFKGWNPASIRKDSVEMDTYTTTVTDSWEFKIWEFTAVYSSGSEYNYLEPNNSYIIVSSSAYGNTALKNALSDSNYLSAGKSVNIINSNRIKWDDNVNDVIFKCESINSKVFLKTNINTSRPYLAYTTNGDGNDLILSSSADSDIRLFFREGMLWFAPFPATDGGFSSNVRGNHIIRYNGTIFKAPLATSSISTLAAENPAIRIRLYKCSHVITS